jgi:hypothetical protein
VFKVKISIHNKTDHHDIAEILLKVALNTIWDISTFNIIIKSDINMTQKG